MKSWGTRATGSHFGQDQMACSSPLDTPRHHAHPDKQTPRAGRKLQHAGGCVSKGPFPKRLLVASKLFLHSLQSTGLKWEGLGAPWFYSGATGARPVTVRGRRCISGMFWGKPDCCSASPAVPAHVVKGQGRIVSLKSLWSSHRLCKAWQEGGLTQPCYPAFSFTDREEHRFASHLKHTALSSEAHSLITVLLVYMAGVN